MLELARRSHDFALIGVAVVLTLDQDERCQQARMVFLSAGEGPVIAQQAAALLKNQLLSQEVMRAAAEIAAQIDIDPSSDIHASAEYRRHLAGILAFRALEKAYDRAHL